MNKPFTTLEELERDYLEGSHDLLNTIFESDIRPLIEKDFPDDPAALDQGFNDWTDSLCKDGVISDLVYRTCYREESDE